MKLLIVMALVSAVTLLGCNVNSSAGSRQPGRDDPISGEVVSSSRPKLNVLSDDVGNLKDLPRISTSLERLFRLVPEQMANSTPIFFNDYELRRSISGPEALVNLGTATSSDSQFGDGVLQATEQNASFSSMFPAPWISGMGRYSDNFPGYPYLGLDSRSIGSTLRLGEATEAYEVVVAPIETETVIRNIEGCNDCPPVSIVRNGEIAWFSWREAIAGDIRRRYVQPFFDQFGRAGHLVIGDGHVIRFPKSAENDAMLPAFSGHLDSKSFSSLSESALYRPIIDALSRFDVLTARISADSRSSPVLHYLVGGFPAIIGATADVVNYGGVGTRSVVAVVVFEDDGDWGQKQKLVLNQLSRSVRNGDILLENQKEIGEVTVKLWSSGPVSVVLIQDAFLLKKEHLIPPPQPGMSIVVDDRNHSPPSVQIAFDLADIVFEGVVQAPQESRWTTENGKRPAVGDDELFGNPDISIITPYPIAVDNVLKGKYDQAEFTYFLGGGQVGDDSFTIGSDFDFVSEGMRAVFFFRKRSSVSGVMDSDQLIERYELDANGNASGRYEETTLQNIKLYAISFADGYQN